MNPEQKETASSATELLITELREQILFLREELRRVRAAAETERRRMDEYRVAQEQQLAVKDTQIERLLRLLEGHRPASPEGEPSQLAEDLRARAISEVPEGPTAAAPPPEKAEAAAAASSRPVETLRQYLKSPSQVCPYLRARQDPTMFHGYPSGNNVCWSPLAPKSRDRGYKTVDGNQQINFCLNERHTECHFFKTSAESEETPPPAEPSSVGPSEESQKLR